jgi:iron complex transport system substrate-binding protein
MSADPSTTIPAAARVRGGPIRKVRALLLPVLLPAILLLGCSSSAATPAPSASPTAAATVAGSAAASPTGVEASLGGACKAAPSGTAGTADCTTAPGAGLPSADATVSASSAPTLGVEPLRYPLTLQDDEGNVVILDRAPTRIVSLTPASTETLFALGAGDLVVGGSEGDDYPAAAKNLPKVAKYTGVEIEKVVALTPDLVIAGGNRFTPTPDIEKLRSLGIQVLVVYAPSVDGVLKDIDLIGRAAGKVEAATSMVASLRSRIRSIAEAAQAVGPRQRVFYELDATKEIYGPAPKSFLAEMIVMAGGDPITTGNEAIFAISLERLVAADPQVIILGDAAYGTTAEIVAARPGWENMTAVRQGAIRPVNDVIVSRPGPRIADGLAALALAINPTLALPSDEAPGGSASPGTSTAP